MNHVLDLSSSVVEVYNAHPENEEVNGFDKQTGIKLASKKVILCYLRVDLYQSLDYISAGRVITLLDDRHYSFYPRDTVLARVFATATCLSVCLSVWTSVTRRYCA